MAESYRGLTIRIGGDTTNLQKALKSSTSAISQTQSELRKLGTAVKLDPSNIKAYNLQMGYLASQAAETAMRLKQLKMAEEDVAKQEVKVQVVFGDDDIYESVQSIIDGAKKARGLGKNDLFDASTELGKSKVALQSVTESLSSAHTEASKLVEIAAKVEKLKLKDAFNLAAGVTSVEELTEKWEKLDDGIKRTPDMVKDIVESIVGMGGRLSDWLAGSLDSGKLDPKGLREILDEFNKMPNGIRVAKSAVEELSDAAGEFGEKLSQSIAAGEEKVEELRKEQRELQEDASQIRIQVDDSLQTKIESGQKRVNAAIEEGNALIAQAEAEMKAKTQAISEAENASLALAAAEELVAEKEEAAADARRKASEAISSIEAAEKSMKEIEFTRAAKGFDDFTSAADGARASLKAASDAYNDFFYRDKGKSEAVETIKAAQEANNAYLDELNKQATEVSKKQEETWKAGLQALEEGNSELHDKIDAEADDLQKKWKNVFNEELMAQNRSSQLITAEYVRGKEVALECATEIRKAYEQVWMLTGDAHADMGSDTDSPSLDQQLKTEIDAAKALLAGYREYYKETLSHLRTTLNSARKAGDNEFAEEIEAEIESFKQAREIVEKNLNSQIGKLETERKAIEKVRLGALQGDDYKSRSVVDLYEEISQKIEAVEQSRDGEKQKVDSTIASLREQGKSQEEINEAVSEGLGLISDYDEQISTLKRDLSTIKGSGSFYDEALKKALETSAAESLELDRKQAEEEESINQRRLAAQAQLKEAREEGSRAEEELLKAEQARDEAAANLSEKQAKADIARASDVAEAREQAAKRVADAEAVVAEKEAAAAEASRKVAAAKANLNEVGRGIKADEIERLSKGLDGVATAADEAREALAAANETKNLLADDNMSEMKSGIEKTIDERSAHIAELRSEYEELAVKCKEAHDELQNLEGSKFGDRRADLRAENMEYTRLMEKNRQETKMSVMEASRLQKSAILQDKELALASAAEIREALQNVWMLTGDAYANWDKGNGKTLDEQLESEIEIARSLLDGYRKYYKTSLAELRNELDKATKTGKAEYGDVIRDEIENLESSKKVVESTLKSYISRLVTERREIAKATKVLDSNDYTSSNPVDLYDEISRKIDETKEDLARERQAVKETTAALKEQGKTEEEINEAIGERLDRIAYYKEQLSVLQNDLNAIKGHGANYIEAFQTARSATAEKSIELSKKMSDADEAERQKLLAAHAQILDAQDEEIQANEDLAKARQELAEASIDFSEKQAKAEIAQADSVAAAHMEKARIVAEAEAEADAGVMGAIDQMSGKLDEYDSKMKQSADKEAEIAEQRKKNAESFIKQLADFSSLGKNVGNLVSEAFTNARGNTDPEYIRVILQGIASDAGLSEVAIDNMTHELYDLSDAFIEADTTEKKWKVVAKFQDMLVETKKGEAELEKFSSILSSIDIPSKVSKGMVDLASNSKLLESAFGELMQSGSRLEGAYAADPSNVQALEAAMKAYSAAALTASEASARLGKQIDGYDTSKFEHLSDGSKSLSQALFDAKEAAYDANKRLADIQGAVDAYESEIGRLQNVRKFEDNGKSVRDEWKEAQDTVKEYEAEIERLREPLNEARQAAKEANAAKELAQEAAEYDNLIRKAAEYEQQVTSAYEAAARAAAQGSVQLTLGESPREVTELSDELQRAVSRAKALQEAAKLDPGNMELATAKAKAFEDVADLAAKNVSKIDEALSKLDPSKVDQMRERFGSVERAVDETEKRSAEANRRFDEMRAKLAALVKDSKFDDIRDDIMDVAADLGDKLDPAVDEVRKSYIEAAEAAKTFAADAADAASAAAYQELSSSRAEIGVVSANIMKPDEAAFQQAFERISQYAERAGRAIITSANEIDAAYRDMRKTVSGTEDQFESLRNEAIAFSKEHITSADTILEIESLGGQLGIAASALQSFGENIANVVIATDITAEDAALKFGQLTNVMSDLDDTTFQNVADALVRLGNTTATTESEIFNVAQRMSAVANVTRMTAPELLAWSAAIASTGQRSESAATAITRTITGIGEAVAEGGKKLDAFAEIAGMSSDKFEQVWRESSSDALKAFVKGLETLTDDSTEAISALDEAGISSVRQENALLALSQTIENLDGALWNATDAFNGGGDAAREAQQKSEGFSGSLGILRNNVQNLGAALGDGLVPLMNALSSVLSVVSSGLDMLPGPLKTAVVEVGVLNIAFGGLLATLRGLGFEVTVAGLTKLATAEGIATVATTGLHAAMNALPMIGWITAAITGINALVGTLSEAYEHAKLLDEATSGLQGSHDLLGESYAGTSSFSTSLDEIKSRADQSLQSVAALGEAMRDTWSEVGANAKLADEYAEKIAELGNKGGLTHAELAELKNAVEQFNSITGASVGIVNDLTGELNVSKDAISAVTEAYKEQAEAKAYADLYNEAVKERIKLQSDLERSTRELDELEEKYGLDLGNGWTWMGFHVQEARKLKQEQDDLGRSIEAVSREIDEMGGHLSSSASKFGDYGTAVVAAGMDTSEFAGMSDAQKAALNEIQRALEAAGDSLVNYGNLTAAQLAKVVSLWTGSVPDIQAALKAMSAEASVKVTTHKPSTEEYNARKKQYDKEYKNRKKQLDDAYKDEKKRLDKEYKATQKTLDKEYKATQKTLDKEYKAVQKNLDAEYKAVQKTFDKEYKAAQKASQDYLKDFKKTQDEAVKAFKDATEDRIKLIDKEYEAKKKALDDEYEGYDAEIQAKIDAIDAEQEAEDKARRDEERRRKVAELTDKVNHAKSKRDRAEAEQDLADYLADIEEENRKEAREALKESYKKDQEALKDQLKEREETLKESYDTAKENYKEAREEQLEALKEANTKEYEEQQEAESAKLEALKESQTIQLEALKESQTIQLEALKEAQTAQLEALKESQTAQLEAIKEANDNALETMKEGHDTELENLKDSLDAKLESYKQNGDEVVKAIEDAGDKATDAATNATAKVGAALDVGFATILEKLKNSQLVTPQTYLGSLNGLPWEIASIFDQVGLTVDTGLDQVASIMLQRGEITLQQFMAVMSGAPGSARLICNETGVAIAEELGLIDPIIEAKATGFKNTMVGGVQGMADAVKVESDKAGFNIASLGGQEAVNSAQSHSETLHSAIKAPLDALGTEGESAGAAYPLGLASGMAKYSKQPVETAGQINESTVKSLNLKDALEAIGKNGLIGLNNGMVTINNQTLVPTLESIARNITRVFQVAMQIHSPSRRFMWIGNMAMKGLQIGVEQGADGVYGGLEDISETMLDEFSGQKFQTSFLDDLLEQMRAEEQELREQSERMARIVEEGFDPTLTVQAAYEAIDRIDAGEMRKQQRINAKSEPAQSIGPTVNINISIPEMVVREEADIKRISEQIARNVQRVVTSKIG
jgi:TP901 family phage tail tape measure protein